MKKSDFFCFLIFAFCAFNIYAQEPNIQFSHLTVSEGLSHTDANDIAQDSKGFIWIATYSGLNKYDGYDIEHYYNELDKLQRPYANRILSLSEDPHSKIWLATEGGIQCFDAVTEKFLPVLSKSHDSIIFDHISTIGENIVVATSKNQLRLFRFENQHLIEIHKSGFKTWRLNNFAKDTEGNLWLSLNNSQVGVIKPNLEYAIFKINDPNHFFNGQSLQLRITNKHKLLLNNSSFVFESADFSSKIINGKRSSLTGKFNALPVDSKTTVKDIIQDFKGRFWIGTSRGLLQTDSDFKISANMIADGRPAHLTSDVINRVLIDRSGCLWVTTFGGGVNILDLNAKMFYSIRKDPIRLENTLVDNHIRAIVEEDGRKLWIGTNYNGLDCYDFITKKFDHFGYSGPQNTRLQNDNIRALTIDKSGNLWIGSTTGLDVLSKDRNKIKHIVIPLDDKKYFKTEISSLAVDKFNQVWVGAWNEGLTVISNSVNSKYSVHHFSSGAEKTQGLSSNRITYVYADPVSLRIFVGTDEGINILTMDAGGKVMNIEQLKGNNSNSSLSSNYIWPIERKDNQSIWAGSLGGGLNLVSLGKNKYSAIPITDTNVTLNDVESLLTDHHGNVWMGGTGLYMYDPKAKNFKHYDFNDGLQGNSFKVGAACKGKNNRLYFGGTNGVCYFNPDSINLNKIPAFPVITSITLNNHVVTTGSTEGNDSFNRSISYTSQIALNHLQNNFVIRFSAMHFANPNKCQYRYKLEGYDKDWKTVDAKIRSAAYSNLDYKKYYFRLEASNNDGIWGSNQTDLVIEVMAPWYNTAAAKVIYCIIALGILIGIYYSQGRWYRLKKTLEIQQLEERKKEEIHQLQLQFFTNISHELRTPLTLIAGPLERLVKEKESPFSHYFHTMQKNVYRLLGLINELMDFRKVETGGINLHVKKGNINQFVREIAEDFEELSEQRAIKINLITLPDNFEAFFDHQVLEKVLINLVDNSFKYSKSGTEINIELLLNFDNIKPRFENSYILKNELKINDKLFLKVSDHGVGISKESIAHIFDRYYRINDSHMGSGVGLALVRSLTLMHKGDIYVFSERDRGTDIIIAIPYTENSYSPEEKEQPSANFEKVRLESLYGKNNIITELKTEIKVASVKDDVSRKTILIVDDNSDIRDFIRSSLDEYYHVDEAINGINGLEKAKEIQPDLIISDVMMPGMDGNEFCEKVKNDIEISHIPFFMLTAKTSLPSKLEGVESGADAYFSKPISIELLLLTIKNTLSQREKIKEHYLRNYNAQAKDLVHTKKDRDFIEKVIELVHANIEMENMDIDFLCNNLNMSHSKLYQKIKSLTSQTISEFIRSVRLRMAVQIMTHEDVPMSEVMYRVGIQSQSYFTRAFKKEFGKTPSQYIQELT